MREPGLTIETVYSDPDLVEVVVLAGNRWFSGASTFYTGEEELNDVARVLKGFPVNREDVRLVTLGERIPASPSGYVALKFFCRDGSGHIIIEARIAAGHDYGETHQEAIVAIPAEAAAVDRFIQELELMAGTGRGTAHLVIADQHGIAG
jgi:hypothetical protein